MCPICNSSVRVPVGDDTLQYPQFQQVTDYMCGIGWQVLSKGFRIDCLCPDCAALLDEQQEGEE
jgi:hypothetical protein